MDELKRLDLLIHLQVLCQRGGDTDDNLRQFKGLVISDGEIEDLLARSVGRAVIEPPDSPPDSERRTIEKMLADCEAEMGKRKAASSLENVFLPLPFLSDIFQLTPFEEQCLIICLAIELDKKYAKFYGYLHDDVTRRLPSVGLVLDIFGGSFEEKIDARRFFDRSAPLIRYQLLHFAKDSSEGSQTLLSRPLNIDERIANLLLDIPCIDNRLEGAVRFADADERPDLVTLPLETQSRLKDFASSLVSGNRPDNKNLVLHFHGPYGTGRHSMAKSVCRYLGIPLLIADPAGVSDTGLSMEEFFLLAGREAALHSAALCLSNFDLLVAVQDNHRKITFFKETARQFSRLVFLVGTSHWNPPERSDNEIFLSLEFPVPDDVSRRQFWENKNADVAPVVDGIDFGELAGKFRFTPGQIQNALFAARDMSLWRHGSAAPVSPEDLHAACRKQSHSKLGALISKIEPKFGWKDIILPDDQAWQLREICGHARYRHIVYGEWGFDRKLSRGRGLNALFSGPPGTGKTMAAEVIANELGLDLFKIDLSQVVSKYIGETEKNLDIIFREAGISNAILFFDEADALFGKRSEVKDAHDRYANIETGYLLQKMEEYEGIAILATNLRSNMDEAFIRRMNFIVDLPFPRERERRAIWEGIWPESTPRSEGLDLDFVARRFEITGGNIRNIALAAAFMAADNGGIIDMKHLVNATRREYQKMGKIVSEGEFGEHKPQDGCFAAKGER
ncbi:MAG TPA: AAA family ATPase [Geobacteraceae bacterium]|nr:AAA family ATPase [Geobacteraceae bacterium]